MKITLVIEGKIRNKKALEWMQIYQKRMVGHSPLDIVEWGTSHKAREEKFFSTIKGDSKLVMLDEGGKSFSSRSLAGYLEEVGSSYRNLYLFVGEAAGHSSTVLSNVKEKWSLSELTMSYEIALVVLCEQLYRSMTIQTGHPYHK